ncbi:MAG: SRPBCC family protein [Planctomycetota bacterium]|nr:MAG: SRPBCC family protein [Planctomycetota bacterium]
MRTEYRMDVRCRPATLWQYLDEADKQKLWLTTLVDFEPTSSNARTVGSTFDMRVREGRRISHYEGRINAYDPPRHLGVSFWGGYFPPGTLMRVDYRVADLGEHCRLEYYAEIDLSNLRGPSKLAIPLARVFAFFQLRYFMRNLKRLAEGTAKQEATRGLQEQRSS